MARPSTQVTQARGNTNSRCRKWCFTINNPATQPSCVQEFLDRNAKAFVFQEERGEAVHDQQGTLHYQGCVEWKNAKTFAATRDCLTFPKVSTSSTTCATDEEKRNQVVRPHIEKCRSWEDSIVYCQKVESRTRGPWLKNVRVDVPIIDYLAEVTLYDWQQDMLNVIDTPPDGRTVHWWWESVGNTGKTSFARHLVITMKTVLYLHGRARDAFFAVKTWIETVGSFSVVIFDIPRCCDEKFISYSSIEGVLNGVLFSPKYEGAQVLFNWAHVFVFANCEPDMHKLSMDRWDIREL